MPILPLNHPEREPEDDAGPEASAEPTRAYEDEDPRPARESRRQEFRMTDFRDDDLADDSRERFPMRGRLASRQDAERELSRSESRANATPAGSTPSLEENNLLQRIHMGSEDALGEFYDRYGKILYSVALRVLRDPAAAEDVLCDLFVDIWRNTENYLSIRGPLSGWLAVAARNRSIDALRRKRSTQTMEDILLSTNLNLSQESQRTTMMEKARSVIQALPGEQRKTLEMAFFDGLTHIEISEMSGENESAVRARLRAALLTLRKAMQA